MALTDMVIMPGADYQSMCDSMRSLDGSTDVIKSGDYSGKVQAVSDTVDTQADLIAQIKSEHETQIAAIKTALEGKAAGSGGTAVEYEIITIPAGATSATYTLPRVTAAYGIMLKYLELDGVTGQIITGVCNDTCVVVNYAGDESTCFDYHQLYYENGTMRLTYGEVIAPISVTLVNDPNAEAIST